jgi:heme-degrading monooxygenase HmoA
MKLLPKFPLPYYAVIFTSVRTDVEEDDYQNVNSQLEKTAATIDGFLGIESARNSDSQMGIATSYWQSLEAIDLWRKDSQHKMAKKKGSLAWYSSYSLRICKVEHESFQFTKD